MYEIVTVRNGVEESVADGLTYDEAMQQAPIVAGGLAWRGDTNVYVQWTRKTDNQHGYLDQDGNHVATGHAWRPIVVTVTRRNRNIGFGWTTVTRQTPRGLEVRDISTPSIIGTVKTVLAQIDEDVNYQSLGLTYHRVQWFLKIDGAWRKVNFIDEIRYLYEPYADGYVLDSVDAMITG